MLLYHIENGFQYQMQKMFHVEQCFTWNILPCGFINAYGHMQRAVVLILFYIRLYARGTHGLDRVVDSIYKGAQVFENKNRAILVLR